MEPNGTTNVQGAYERGTVFRFDVGFGPFVRTIPGAAKVGTPVTVLGTNLTGVTSLTFNGVPAVFTVVSPTEIATSVPAGATTGKVEVTTPSATISSNVVFPVIR